MTELAKQLLKIFQRNRNEHEKKWRKVRHDRLRGLFLPEVTSEEIDRVVNELVVAGELEWCEAQDRDSKNLVKALKLTKFVFTGKFPFER